MKKKKVTKRKKTKLSKLWLPTIKKIVQNGTNSYQYMLTDNQYSVLTDWMIDNITQQKMANKRGIHQTSIHKSLFGNVTYPDKKRYGGIFNKIKKMDSGNYTVGKGKYIKEI